MTIKQNVLDLSASIQKGSVVDNVSGHVEISKNAWVDNLPEGITEDTVTKVHEYRDNFIAATNLAVGQLGLKATEENKDLKKVTGTTNFYKDTLTVGVSATRTTPNPQKPGETVTRHGASSTNYVAVGGQNKAQLKKVRTWVSEQYEALANG